MIHNRHVYRNEAEEGKDGGGAVVDDKTPAKVEGETGEAEVSLDIIAKAEKMGWTPREQFRGDPAKWRPADEFVERGEKMLPILQANVRKQEREIAELKASMRELGEYHSKTAQREHEKALQQLRQERADAIAKGDGVAFDKVDAQIADLRTKVETKAPQKQDDAETVAFNEWLSRNKWAEDRKLQTIGKAIADTMVEDGESARGTALLDMVTVEMKRRYPEKFENPRRNAAPTVEGGTGQRKSGGKAYADMPAEARAACDRMARNAYSDKPEEQAKFKAEYVRNFFAD